jgi:hypothetical protein
MLVPFQVFITCATTACCSLPTHFTLSAQYTRFYNSMGGRGNPGRGRGGPRGSPRGSSPAPDRGRGGGFRGGDRGRGRGDSWWWSWTRSRWPSSTATCVSRCTKAISRGTSADDGARKEHRTLQGAPSLRRTPFAPGIRNLGTKILLRANFFQVQFKEGLVIYDYDVKITPTTDIARLKGRIFELLERNARIPEIQAVHRARPEPTDGVPSRITPTAKF